MSIEAVIFGDIAKSKLVQLRSSTSTSGIHRKQYRPCDATANEADKDNELEEA